MKYAYLIVFILVASCSSRATKEHAYKLLNDADFYAKKSIRGEMPPAEANLKISPLMKEFNEVLPKLNHDDSMELQKYRYSQLQELISLQLKYNK